MMAGLAVEDDLPRLELPAAVTKVDYGASSLPNGVRLPLSSYAIAYAPELVSFPSKELRSSSVGGTTFEDLKYRRKPGLPSQMVPAPLYFRQSAAAAHSSPALLPSSPPRQAFSPKVSPARPPSISSANVMAFALPPPVSPSPSPSIYQHKHQNPAPSSIWCGRPGCVGEKSDSGNSSRRASWNSTSSSGLVTRRPNHLESADLLMSPRIRALRSEADAPSTADPVDEDSTSSDELKHSAFACYLFSQLSNTASPPQPDPSLVDWDSQNVPPNPSVPNGNSGVALEPSCPSSASTVRAPVRTLFGRGPQVGSPPLAALDEVMVADTKLTPGRFIAATTDSSFSSVAPSPFPSPPASPPTVSNRGRSSTRDAAPAVDSAESPLDPRGRSKFRPPPRRSLSPTRDESPARGRDSNASSHERGRQGSKSSARGERSETRGRESQTRGRSRREEVRAEDDADGEEEEERGRRGRSKSLLMRGRGREVAISGAAYGHYDSP